MIERVVPDGRVQLRVVAQGLDDGTGDEWKVRETDALLLAEPLFVSLANLVDAFVVGLDHGERVSRRRLRPHHVLGREAADVGEGHDVVTRSGDGHVVVGGGDVRAPCRPAGGDSRRGSRGRGGAVRAALPAARARPSSRQRRPGR